MKRLNHVFIARVLHCLCAAALALGCVQVAHAGFSKSQWSDGARIDWDSGTIDKTAQWVPAVGSKVAGNSGYLVANGSLNAVSTSRLPVGAGYIDVTARVVPDKLSAAKAVIGFMSKVAFPLQIGIAAYDLLKELNVTPTRDASGNLQMTKQDPTVCTVAPCYEYQGYYGRPWFSTPEGACRDSATYSAKTFISITGSGIYTYCNLSGNTSNLLSTRSIAASQPVYIPTTMQELQDKIASESGWPSSSAFPQAVADAVNSGEVVTAPPPTVTGPTSANGPTSTTVENGATVTKNTVYNINYNNNQVSYTTTVTTTTNNAGNVTTKTETTENDQPVDECTKNPSSLNCSQLDVPDGTIPKTTKNIVYNVETWFGGGSCPADKFLTTHGQEIKVWNWSGSCTWLTSYFRPVLLILASVMAMFIVLPKGAEV